MWYTLYVDPKYRFTQNATSAAEISYYDYIIIGGGTAGCPLAATLSEKYSVLVLERGGSPYGNPNITNLTSFGAALSDTSPTSPAQRFISQDGVINSRARVLGGGTCLNAGFYTRTSPQYVRYNNIYSFLGTIISFTKFKTPLVNSTQENCCVSVMCKIQMCIVV